MSFIFQRALSGGRSFLIMAWSKLTDIPFLTLLIAVGTLATALVAYRTALESNEQVQLLKRQVDLNSMETRPFVRTTHTRSGPVHLSVNPFISSPSSRQPPLSNCRTIRTYDPFFPPISAATSF
jgi:hypothetical protein